jgi:hypothetical protein
LFALISSAEPAAGGDAGIELEGAVDPDGCGCGAGVDGGCGPGGLSDVRGSAILAKIRPQAAEAAKLDKDIETARQRTILLDQLRKRSKMDIDVVGEMTRILPPPIWLNTLEITRTQVTVAGETDQAAPLLKQIDASPFFEASEFAMQPMRTATGGEMFRIRSNREAGK